MATIYTHQSQNVFKTWLLMGFFLVLIIAIGWVFSETYGNPNILYIAVILSVVINIGSYWYSDKIVVALSRAHPADANTFRELHRSVENLAITAGLPKPKVYIIDDPAPNAFATGRNKEHAVVAVTTGLLSVMNKNELEGVLAHELSHVGNRDILISTVAVVLAGLVTIAADMFLHSGLRGRSRGESGGGGAIALIGLALSILAPIAALLIRLAVSRRRESLADASGVLLTRYPEGLASALEKIAAYTKPMQHTSNATAHLYISNPFGARAAKGLSRLFMTHPPVEERIAALREMGDIRES